MRISTFSLIRPAAAVLLAVLVLGAAAGCERTTAPSRRPDVFVIAVDSLRRDRLDLYGYARATAPTLRGLAADAVVFTNAYSTSSWARPAVASLLTGAWPDRGGRDGLASDVFTMPELLGPAGYRSHAITSDAALADDPGFAQGFTSVTGIAGGAADAVVRAALDVLGKEDPAQPLLLLLHLGDPRGPYVPPGGFVDEWAPQGTGPFDPREITPDTPAARMADLHAAYDAEIAFVDRQIGLFLDAVRQAKRYDDALIVVAATHGEEFQEHGRGGHGRTLFEEVVAIPMVVKYPRKAGAGESVHGPVSLVDVLPTTLPLVGVKTNARIDGIDLAPVTESQGQAIRDRSLFFFLDAAAAGTGQGTWRAVLQRGDKYIVGTAPGAAGQVYRLALDPYEQSDVAGSESARAERLTRALGRMARSKPATGELP
jgi:arylsulfatase A-like enzyme